jgi:hypothetical protein
MAALIPSLIEQVDTLELVRDQIAAILLVESTNQQALATTAGKDPRDWELRIFTERTNPWSEFIEEEDNKPQKVTTPIVNVSFNDDAADMGRSNIIERQLFTGIFHVDCYGCGFSAATEEGHDPGDARAAIESQRAARLCRKILMSAMYVDLGMPGLIWRRWIPSRTSLSPQFDARPAQHVNVMRVAMQVEYNEFSPQWEGNPLELISIQMKRAENGQVLFTADFPHTP